MKTSLSFFLCTAVGLAPALALPAGGDQLPDWHPPGPGDVRAPCPMLNTLANHGFLPHNGKNITKDITVKALNTALNIEEPLGQFLFDFAVTTNPTPNATVFSLENLGRHNVLEHDASLSRTDAINANPVPFNQTVFDETRSYWKGDVIDLQMAATARHARVVTSARTNPNFTLSELGAAFSYGETAAYLIVLGDRSTVTAKKPLVEYLFQNERLPTELGWSKPDVITKDILLDALEKVIAATGTSPETAARLLKRGGMHVGLSPMG